MATALKVSKKALATYGLPMQLRAELLKKNHAIVWKGHDWTVRDLENNADYGKITPKKGHFIQLDASFNMVCIDKTGIAPAYFMTKWQSMGLSPKLVAAFLMSPQMANCQALYMKGAKPFEKTSSLEQRLTEFMDNLDDESHLKTAKPPSLTQTVKVGSKTVEGSPMTITDPEDVLSDLLKDIVKAKSQPKPETAPPLADATKVGQTVRGTSNDYKVYMISKDIKIAYRADGPALSIRAEAYNKKTEKVLAKWGLGPKVTDDGRPYASCHVNCGTKDIMVRTLGSLLGTVMSDTVEGCLSKDEI